MHGKDLTEFVEKCRKICSEKGIDSQSRMTSVVEGPCRFYKDETIKITCASNSQEMEIERMENKNPVIMVDKNGKVYRTHGEAWRLKIHVCDIFLALPEFKYIKNEVPDSYVCKDCGASKVRLYREYQTFRITLRCTKCSLINQDKTEPDGNHTIGWLVAAVPTEQNDTYWGFTSVPEDGVNWWNNLSV